MRIPSITLLLLILIACSRQPQTRLLEKQLLGTWQVDNPSSISGASDTLYLVRKSKYVWCLDQQWTFQPDATSTFCTTDYCKSLSFVSRFVYQWQLQEQQGIRFICKASSTSTFLDDKPDQASPIPPTKVDTLYFGILKINTDELILVRQKRLTK